MAVVNLTNCDREPIRILGSIQPQGAMRVCDPASTPVVYASATAEPYWGAATKPHPPEGGGKSAILRLNGLPACPASADLDDHALRSHVVCSGDRTVRIVIRKLDARRARRLALGFEAWNVIDLRMAKVTMGGKAAEDEFRLMLTEKMRSAAALQTLLISGRAGYPHLPEPIVSCAVTGGR